MLLPSGNPIKCRQEFFLSLQPMFPPSHNVLTIFPLIGWMLRIIEFYRGLDAFIFFFLQLSAHKYQGSDWQPTINSRFPGPNVTESCTVEAFGSTVPLMEGGARLASTLVRLDQASTQTVSNVWNA